MRSQHFPMPVEEYEIMPWKLGWKYEYWDGNVHITPREQIVMLQVEVKPRLVDARFTLKPVDSSDEARLVDAFIAAFGDTIEYCDWTPEKIASAAQHNIRIFLTGKRGAPLPASRLTMEVHPDTGEARLIGAALLIDQNEECPLLDMLFVIPEWQHQGLGTTLVSAAVNDLYKAGVKTLKSRYALGNEMSRSWHQKFGFVEEPDLFLARLYYHHVYHELWRREQLDDLTKAERQQLMSEVEHWNSRVEELEKIAEEQGMEAVVPLLRSRG